MAGNPPQIFIAHANEDKPLVRELYAKLVEAGYRPWFDEEDLLPGQNWRDEIPKALKNSDLFIACLSSNSISKRGYIQREFKMAMEMLAELPPGEIYLIPLKFDDCTIPELRQSEYGLNLRDIQWLDYGKPNGFEKLIKSIEYQFGSQGTYQNDTAINQGAGDNVPGKKRFNDYIVDNEQEEDEIKKQEELSIVRPSSSQTNLRQNFNWQQIGWPRGNRRQVLKGIGWTGIGIGIMGLAKIVERQLTSSPSKPLPSAKTEKKRDLEFEFQFLTVNDKGKEIKRETSTAQYRAEDLGNDVTLACIIHEEKTKQKNKQL
ncbi:toll/interleukin-1 receptor domain-containing protein, partial [Crocosphaera sp. Alani8]|uniref:toll/interleukin-1 receptor domain-containing protein n=1 Tax=Crocosphaera sp. Alani8 TaxID=3038952 RepID=UPI00313E5BF6